MNTTRANKRRERMKFCDEVIELLKPEVLKALKLMKISGMTAGERKEWNLKRKAAAFDGGEYDWNRWQKTQSKKEMIPVW